MGFTGCVQMTKGPTSTNGLLWNLAEKQQVVTTIYLPVCCLTNSCFIIILPQRKTAMFLELHLLVSVNPAVLSRPLLVNIYTSNSMTLRILIKYQSFTVADNIFNGKAKDTIIYRYLFRSIVILIYEIYRVSYKIVTNQYLNKNSIQFG